MRHKLRGVPKSRQKRESFIRLRPDDPVTISSRMSRSGDGGGSQHLRDDQIARAKQVVTRLKDQFGSLSAVERASISAGTRLKQQTLSTLLNNGQCGYRLAENIMVFARGLPEFRDLPSNYIIQGADGGRGTEPAPRYALRPMRYRAKGELLDRLSADLPGEFLDFTAARDPIEADAEKWSPADWFVHVGREFELWKYMQTQGKAR